MDGLDHSNGLTKKRPTKRERNRLFLYWHSSTRTWGVGESYKQMHASNKPCNEINADLRIVSSDWSSRMLSVCLFGTFSLFRNRMNAERYERDTVAWIFSKRQRKAEMELIQHKNNHAFECWITFRVYSIVDDAFRDGILSRSHCGLRACACVFWGH